MESNVQISYDFSKMDTLDVYEGRCPKYDNEIAIAGNIAEKINKSIGDTVSVRYGGYSLKYIITGYTQDMNGGTSSIINSDGIKMIMPKYSMRRINVYFKEGTDYNAFVKQLNDKFGILSDRSISADNKYDKVKQTAEAKIANLLTLYNVDSAEYAVIFNGNIITSGNSNMYKIEKVSNIKHDIESSLGSITAAISALTIVISVITMIIIILILSLMIKAMIIKRKVEFGTYKAIGYTTFQIMVQIAVSFLPTSFAGTISGTILAYIFVNPILTAGLKAAGISKFNAVINV